MTTTKKPETRTREESLASENSISYVQPNVRGSDTYAMFSQILDDTLDH